MKNILRGLLFFLLLLKNVSGFGLNKVQYEDFKWKYVQTEHFDIYFTQGGDRIAKFAARHVEVMYDSVSQIIGHRISARVPIILHNSHAQFQQTNVIRLPLHEGIGGFTEIFKNRVVLPFEGDYFEFYHVLHHELVHAVIFDMLFGIHAASALSAGANRFPLWVNEGIAEYASLGWNLGSEFFMLDATTFGYVPPPQHIYGGFLAYKGGQLFFYFMAQTFGPETVTQFIQHLRGARDVQSAFKAVTNVSLEEVGEIWLRELRRVYWPELGKRGYGKTVARKLTSHGKDLSNFNLQPAISPDGTEIAFFSDRDSWEGIYILDIESEEITRSVIHGGKGGKFESLHSFKSGIAWGPESKNLAIVAKSQGRDVIRIINAKSGKSREVIKPDVEAILSPAWSRDGRFIAFNGIKNGYSDIYLYDRQEKSFQQLTNDMATDDKPSFSPSGKYLVFESNRMEPVVQVPKADSLDAFYGLSQFYNIYRISTDGGVVEEIAGGEFDEKMPSYGPSDSTLMYISNQSGVNNIYLWTEGDSIQPVTNLLSGCFTPSWSQDGKLLTFSLFEQGGWDIFLMRDPLDNLIDSALPKTRFIQTYEDTSQKFFRDVNWKLLSSYMKEKTKDSVEANDTTSAAQLIGDSVVTNDSLGTQALSDTTVPDKALPDPGPPGDTLLVARPDSLGESTLVDNDSLLGDDSLFSDEDILTEDDFPEPADSVAEKDTVESGEMVAEPGGPNPFLEPDEYLTKDGNYIVNDYSPKFSLDVAQAAVGYSDFYGPAGQAVFTLSDLMGNHEYTFLLDLQNDISETSAMVMYSFLPMRTDFTFVGYHQAFTPFFYSNDTAYRDRNFGFGTTIKYPFSIYSRLQADLSTIYSTRQEIVYGERSTRVTNKEPEDELFAFMPTFSWSYDNSQWGIVGPINGQRMEAGLTVVPSLFGNNLSFAIFDSDLRKYWRFFKKYTLALRLSLGASESFASGENPHQFLVGGDKFTLNYQIQSANAPNQGLRELYFSELNVPLRGFYYYDFAGTRKAMTNLEFRVPFIQEFVIAWPLPIGIRNVMGALFVDGGGAWSSGNALDQMGVGWGFGLRLNLGIFVLRYTRAWALPPADWENEERRGHNYPITYWSLGAEF